MCREVLCSTGMTPEQSQVYLQIEEKLLPAVDPLICAYLGGEYDHISEVYEPLRALCDTEAELCAAELVFVVRCAEQKAQTLSGRERERFLEALSDIGYKVKECLAYKKAVGIFVLNWYHGLLKQRRLSLGRLQFETVVCGNDRVIGDLVMRQGDVKVQCHIPSSGPLTQQACFDAYRRAWEAFPELRRNGVLPIFCSSWLFYPDYDRVFPESSNVGQFRRNFTVYQVYEQERFEDCWRVFSMDMPEDTSLLPRDTRMQQRFADYIEQGGTFGGAAGVLLFDGEKIL